MHALLGVSQHTGHWGYQKYPVICGLATTRVDGQSLLNGRPQGTFLLRLSTSSLGALVVMFVKHHKASESLLYIHGTAVCLDIFFG